MELLYDLFELILELLLDGGAKVSKNKKFPKIIRYPIIAVILLFFIAVIGAIVLAGIYAFGQNIFVGILLIAFGLFFAAICITRLRKFYFGKTNKE